ncbi:hypothetical protein NL676_007154 [Syzygium grande]|nr:hypothetical protein NL676_007154 [Syzygium grande]
MDADQLLEVVVLRWQEKENAGDAVSVELGAISGADGLAVERAGSASLWTTWAFKEKILGVNVLSSLRNMLSFVLSYPSSTYGHVELRQDTLSCFEKDILLK